MNYIVITDIFGNKISKNESNIGRINNLPFILLQTTQPHLLLKRIENNNKSSIWKLIYPTIMHTLYINKINPSNFAPLGNIWYPKNKLPHSEEIILVNTNPNISKFPTDYVKVGEYNDMNVWKPIAPRGFRAIGYLMGIKKPSIKLMRTVNNKLLTSFRDYKNSVSIAGLSNMNEFKLLTISGNKKYTIDRTKLLEKDFLVRLVSKGGIITNDKGKLKLKKKKDRYQNINYTVQGELRMDNKCIGVSSDDNLIDNYVYLQKCDDTDNQKWYPYSGHFISQYDGSCLTTNDNGSKSDVTVTTCDKNDKQLWRTENLRTVILDSGQDSVESWKTQYGKRVVLLEPDNPWYINKGQKKKPEGVVMQYPKELNTVDYRDNADVYDKFMMDVHTPSMGYGYSLDQRRGRPCSCLDDCDKLPSKEFTFENFDADNKNDNDDTGAKKTGFNFNLIACTLLTIVILLVVVRMILNWRRSKNQSS